MPVPDRDAPRAPARPLSLSVASAILVALTLAAFWPILGSEFSQWDDWEQIAVNQYLNPPSWKGLAKRWAAPFMNIWIPLTHTVWFVLAHFAQAYTPMGTPRLEPFPFKLTNVLVHAATSWIVFLILLKLVPSRWLALLGACLYCLHPVQVEAVGWTSGLKDLLLGLFGAACIFFYLGERGSDRLSARAQALAVLMMACACLSKPTALVLPAMLVVVDLFIARRPLRGMFARLLPYLILGIACAAYARRAQPPVDVGVTLTLLDRLLVPLHSLAFYLQKLVFPTRLAFDYGVNWESLLGTRTLYTAWIAPVAVAVIALLLRRRIPLLGSGLLLAIIPIAPVSGVTVFDFSYYSITSDHYLYLPMLGVSIAASGVLERVRTRTALLLGVPILIACGILTFRQSLTWRDARTATLHTLWVNPGSFSSYSILAVLELDASAGDPEKLKRAEGYAHKALELNPDNPRSINILANILSAQGRHEEALIQWDRTLALAPFDPQYHLGKAGTLGELKRGEEAIRELKLVLQYEPDHRLARQLVDKWNAVVREQRRRGNAPATTRSSGF